MSDQPWNGTGTDDADDERQGAIDEEWQEAIDDRYRERFVDSLLAALRETLGRFPESLRDRIGLNEDLPGPDYRFGEDELGDGEAARRFCKDAANLLWEFAAVRETCVEGEGSPLDADRMPVLFRGVQLLHDSLDRLSASLTGRLTAVGKKALSKVQQAVSNVVSNWWSLVAGYTTLDNWSLGGSVGSSVPGFSGSVDARLTFGP